MKAFFTALVLTVVASTSFATTRQELRAAIENSGLNGEMASINQFIEVRPRVEKILVKSLKKEVSKKRLTKQEAKTLADKISAGFDVTTETAVFLQKGMASMNREAAIGGSGQPDLRDVEASCVAFRPRVRGYVVRIQQLWVDPAKISDSQTREMVKAIDTVSTQIEPVLEKMCSEINK